VRPWPRPFRQQGCVLAHRSAPDIPILKQAKGNYAMIGCMSIRSTADCGTGEAVEAETLLREVLADIHQDSAKTPLLEGDFR
jgi:hypothetical protein